jgi:hypothetical protein
MQYLNTKQIIVALRLNSEEIIKLRIGNCHYCHPTHLLGICLYIPLQWVVTLEVN